MNNPIVQQLADATIKFSGDLHQILDKTLAVFESVFVPQLEFNPNITGFETNIDGIRFIVLRDLNALNIIARVANEDEILASATLNVNLEYTENFKRFPNSELKASVRRWFDLISEITIDEEDQTNVEETIAPENVEVAPSSDEAPKHQPTAVLA